MSLDVYLHVPGEPTPGSGIFIREYGETRQISRDEWDERFPGTEPGVVGNNAPDIETTSTAFDYNITHNLGAMAAEAGLYKALWRPDENGMPKARDLIEPLRIGLSALRAEPARFKAFNPENGWGDYDGLVRFVSAYLAACEEYPDADVRVSR